MYYDKKFLKNNNNNIKLLNIYLTTSYSNNYIEEKNDILQSMKISIDNKDLTTVNPMIYYNSLIPYKNFNNTLPPGYYVYTFSLHPLDNIQPSGFLNFENIDNVTIHLEVSEINYYAKVITKEYNILNIFSGFAALEWF